MLLAVCVDGCNEMISIEIAGFLFGVIKYSVFFLLRIEFYVVRWHCGRHAVSVTVFISNQL